MLQNTSSVFVVYRCKTLTGSPDPTHANSTDKPCTIGGESSPQVLSTEKETRKEADTPETKVSNGLGYCKSEYLVREQSQ